MAVFMLLKIINQVGIRMLKAAEKYHRTFLEVFQDALRFHKRKSGLTSQQLADRIGVEKTTVDKWMIGESSPQCSNLMALTHVFGAEFLNEILLPFGFVGLTEIDCPETNPFRALSQINNSSAVLSMALSDQRIDHTEIPKVTRALDESIEAMQRLRKDLTK